MSFLANNWETIMTLLNAFGLVLVNSRKANK